MAAATAAPSIRDLFTAALAVAAAMVCSSPLVVQWCRVVPPVLRGAQFAQ
jgi:hypothetical protein